MWVKVRCAWGLMACGMCCRAQGAWTCTSQDARGQGTIRRSTDGQANSWAKVADARTDRRECGGGVVLSAAASYRSRSCALDLPPAAADDTCIVCTHSSADSDNGGAASKPHDTALHYTLIITMTGSCAKSLLRCTYICTQDKAWSYIQWLARRVTND